MIALNINSQPKYLRSHASMFCRTKRLFNRRCEIYCQCFLSRKKRFVRRVIIKHYINNCGWSHKFLSRGWKRKTDESLLKAHSDYLSSETDFSFSLVPERHKKHLESWYNKAYDSTMVFGRLQAIYKMIPKTLLVSSSLENRNNFLFLLPLIFRRRQPKLDFPFLS